MPLPTLFHQPDQPIKPPQPALVKAKFNIAEYIERRNKVLAELYPEDKELTNITFGEGKPAYIK